MARISLDLSQFKSAGVYTIEIDQTERVTVTTQSLRLVPGFATQGPFNAPVFIRSTNDLYKFFGAKDIKLERKGSFFQRAIETCLLASPVFALNLLNVSTINVSTNTDQAQMISFSLDTSILGVNNIQQVRSDIYVNFFKRDRFWTPDPEYLLGIATNKSLAANTLSAPLLQIANIGTKKLSFIVRKAVGIQGYSVYAADWYGSAANIPYEWIRAYDQIKDFFIQIIAIEGDWTNYSSLSVDPYWSTYFNAKGLKPAKLTDFINDLNISLAGSWTGCIIPDFKDKQGTDQFIENIVNGGTSLSGIYINVNKNALDQLNYDSGWKLGDGAAPSAATYCVDLVGHNLATFTATNVSTNFLSYQIDVSQNVLHMDVSVKAYPTTDTTRKTFSLDSSVAAAFVTVGTLVKSAATIPGVTYVTGKTFDGSAYIITTAEALPAGVTITIQKPIDDASICTAYKLYPVNGLTLTNKHLPGFDTTGAPNAEAGVRKIYSMLEDAGIERGLTNPDMIQYRYIVDTMAYGLQAEMGGKAYLSRLAKKRGKTTAILNAPSMAQFASSTNPYFCDTFVNGVDPTPIFNTQYIAQGGNPNMPRSFRFSLPTEESGARYCGVFGPFLKYSENGKLISVPPAADVANAYVKKFLGGNPYAIVANKNGILANPNLAGVEYMIDKTDRDYLEPFGYNSIIERPSTGQTMIYANVTAFQTVKSDYNSLHVRELLNTIELQVEEVLKFYVFDFNNPITRLNIINSITPILQSIQDAGALAKYEVIMDETNNTQDVISDGFGIIDINVWITGALTKIVNRITVNKITGETTGGFTTV